MPTSLKSQLISGSSYTPPIPPPLSKVLGTSKNSRYAYDGIANPLQDSIDGYISVVSDTVSFITVSGTGDWNVNVDSTYNESLVSNVFFDKESNIDYAYFLVRDRSNTGLAAVRRFKLSDGSSSVGSFVDLGFNLSTDYTFLSITGNPVTSVTIGATSYFINWDLINLTVNKVTASTVIGSEVENDYYYLPDYSFSSRGFIINDIDHAGKGVYSGSVFSGTKPLAQGQDHIEVNYLIPTGDFGVPVAVDYRFTYIIAISSDTVVFLPTSTADYTATRYSYYDKTSVDTWITQMHSHFEGGGL